MTGDRALALLEDAVRQIGSLPAAERPQLLVDLGDRITDEDPASDRARQAEVASVLARAGLPVVHLLGNHDVAHLTAEENAIALGQEMRPASLDLHGWHLVFWRANPVMTARGFTLQPEDLAWLEADLAATALPAVVFTHAPFSGASMLGNYYFETFPQIAGYTNGLAAREVVERHHVVACLAGHVHWTSLHTLGGTHYLTVQSLSESFSTHPHPAGAWAQLTLGETLDLRVHGRGPMRLQLPLRQPGHSWLRLSESQLAGMRAWVEAEG